MTRVLLVEDDPMARQLLEIYLEQSREYTLSGALESALFAEAFCRSHPVDLVLMDVCTAMNASGIDAAVKIKAVLPRIKIVIITSQPECSFLSRAREAGVDSFWYKNATAAELMGVMDRTMAGQSVYPDTSPSLQLGDALSDQFSERELEVLRLVVAGHTDAAIAEALFISVATVKTHIQNMKNRTGFRNRTELAVTAPAGPPFTMWAATENTPKAIPAPGAGKTADFGCRWCLWATEFWWMTASRCCSSTAGCGSAEVTPAKACPTSVPTS